jgi:PilZ domain-containing protein
MTDLSRRSEPRLSFTDGHVPVLEAGGKSFPILDISAKGVRFLAPATDVTIGDLLRGTIRLSPQRVMAVEGRVLRAANNQVAARLEGGATPVIVGMSRPRSPGGMLW